MDRPERPLDPQAGPVQRLTHQLRLPSLDAVRGYVRACGGDPGEWEPRWKQAEAAVAETVRDETDYARPPYRGLARFEPGDRHLFFGRERMAQELERLVCDHPLAVLFGASGSGKSSLLRAGLIPRLQDRIAGRESPTALRILTPGARPAAAYDPLQTPGEAIGSLACAGDRRTLYANGAHVSLQRYAVDPTRAVRRVSTRVGGDLTREQWRTYGPETAIERCAARSPAGAGSI